MKRIFERHDAALMAAVAVIANLRASFSAASLASAPELQRRRDRQTWRRSIFSPVAVPAVGVTVAGMPELTRLFVQRLTSSGCAWPSAFTAMPPAKSISLSPADPTSANLRHVPV